MSAIKKAGFNTGIEADGHINPSTIPTVVRAGADMLTGGTSGLFLKDKSIRQAADDMRKAAMV